MEKSILSATDKIEKISDKVSIVQNDNLPKFGMDALLLSNFVDKSKSSKLKIADFGSGSGILGLMYASVNPGRVFLIEVNPELVDLENKSIKINDLTDRVVALNKDINDLTEIFKINSLDVIISNPPYFDNVNYEQTSPDGYRKSARHGGGKNFGLDTLFDSAKLFLKSRGKLYFIFRAERIAEIFKTASANGFGIDKICFVYTKKGSDAKLVLVKAIKQSKHAKIKIQSPLILYDQPKRLNKKSANILFSRKYFFYVLKTADNYLYAGTTNDVQKRFSAHQNGKGAKFTKPASRHPLTLVFTKEFNSKSEALSFENKFKKLKRDEKENYINLK